MKQCHTHLQKNTLVLLLCLFVTGSIYAQQLNYLNTSKGRKTLALDHFSQHLSSAYQDSSVGWAYTIWKKGKLLYDKSGGFKVSPADGLNNEGLPFLSSTRIHVASMSKTITAIAIAKLVDQKK